MDLQLSDEQRMIRDMARDFAQNEISPIAAHHDETGEFPHETIMTMGEQGFMGIEVPEEYGGVGMDTIAYVLALEEISKADASHAVIMSVCNSLYCYGILRYGTEEQKQRYLQPVASGEAIGAYALTRWLPLYHQRHQVLDHQWSRGEVYRCLRPDRSRGQAPPSGRQCLHCSHRGAGL